MMRNETIMSRLSDNNGTKPEINRKTTEKSSSTWKFKQHVSKQTIAQGGSLKVNLHM